MSEESKFISPEDLASRQYKIHQDLGTHEIAVVHNPGYVYPPVDFYPLAPRSKGNLPGLEGVVCDMDGTTTTTETLCIHALEYMVRRITNRMDPKEWSGLDRIQDYPHIIGNSTTKHIEYLIRTYSDPIQPDAIGQSYLRAALWTFSKGKDPGRKKEVLATLNRLGLEGVQEEPDFQAMVETHSFEDEKLAVNLPEWWRVHQVNAEIDNFQDRVRAAIDIYYMRYHEILAALEEGSPEQVAAQILGDRHQRLIEPMPGVAIYLAAIKGWLGEDLAPFGPQMFEQVKQKSNAIPIGLLEKNLNRLKALGNYFEKHPLKVGIVTSSIDYEANIVLGQVFESLREEVEHWPVSAQKKNRIIEGFSHYQSYYDAYITASDSSEIRLKPHRDLYCIALHQMGLGPESFDRVVGFEDSESGTIAIRAAGIGLCVALPFADTANHDLSAAAFCLKGGLPEALLGHLHFLNPEML